MDPRKLLYLASVIEHGSFKKAAKHLLLSQPALSASMDRLEDSIGGKLLDRGPSGVTPTALGEVVYSHARSIRDEIDLATRRVSGTEPAPSGPVTLGALPSLATHIIPAAVCRWRERYPALLLRVLTLNQLELTLSLIGGEIGFIIGMTDFYGHLEGLRQRVLFRDRLCVIARPDHPAASMPDLSWGGLAAFPWILQMFGRQRTVLEALLHPDGTALPRQLTECGSVDFIKSLVACSDSLALLPRHTVAADIASGRLTRLELAAPQLDRDIAVVFRERHPLGEASRDLVGEIEAAGTAALREQGI